MTVVAKHIGRMGNNCFQIAAAMGYARKYGYEWGVDPKSGVGEPFSSIHKTFPNLPKAEANGVRYHEHHHGVCSQHNTSYDNCHFDYHDIPDLGPNVLLTGFFQSWKYFEHCKEEVKETFKLPHIAGYEDYVSIHVRRGDYVQHSGSFPPITKEYIARAINIFLKKLPFRKFLIFSDDIEWCKENIKLHVINPPDPELYKKIMDQMLVFSEGKTELEDLSLMASCGHHIIANSSFSWWGAYLGHNPDRVVVSPSKETWFGPTAGVKQPVKDLIPNSWIQINTR